MLSPVSSHNGLWEKCLICLKSHLILQMVAKAMSGIDAITFEQLRALARKSFSTIIVKEKNFCAGYKPSFRTVGVKMYHLSSFELLTMQAPSLRVVILGGVVNTTD